MKTSKTPTRATQASLRSSLSPRGALLLGPVLLGLLTLGIGCGGDIEARMAEVRALQDVGQFSASIEELREILAIAPDNPEAAYRLGVALVQTGESSRAVWALQKAAESPDYGAVAGLLLASAHLNNQNYEEVVRASDRVLEADPDRQLALQLRAKGYLGAGLHESAIEDTRRLIELYPEDYSVRVLHATVVTELGDLDQAEQEHLLIKKLGAESGDPAIEPRSCLAPAIFMADSRRDLVAAEPYFEECLETHPTDAFVINHSMDFFDSAGKPERANEIARAAVDQAPENLQLRSGLAARLQGQGDLEGAEQVLREAAESFDSAAAWNLLAGFYRRVDRPEKALEAIEKVIELSGGGSDQLRFTHADVLIDLGEIERAEAVVAELSEPTYETLIRGRILLEQGSPAEALAAFEKGIRNWPNNAGARYLAGVAARQLGDYDRAISELREAVRADNAATDAALLLARIHFERGEYQQAASFANEALQGPKGTLETHAYVIASRSFTALGRYDRARRAVDSLGAIEGQEISATVERAHVERRALGPDAALAVIRASRIDPRAPGHLMVLRSLADNLVALGRQDEALTEVDGALLRDSESPDLYELRGSVLRLLGRTDDAREAYDKAVALSDDTNAAAYAGLAMLARDAGDAARSIELFDRAAELAPDEPEYAYRAASIALAAGAPDARARLEKIVSRAAGNAGARNDLAWLLAEEGSDLDRALELAQQARRIEARPEILDTLGWVHLKRGEARDAVKAFEEALAADPDSPSLLYRLAMALEQAGEPDRARVTLERALAIEPPGDFPEAEEARRRLAQIGRP